eukprot:scaffold424422_cov44-Prasinocladus_malaysianus.AAC.1
MAQFVTASHSRFVGRSFAQVHEAFLDSINTPAVMDAISEMIKQANKYMSAREATSAAGGPAPQTLLLNKAATYVTRILSVFGIVDGPGDTIGFVTEGKGGGGDTAAPFVDAIASFRDEVPGLILGFLIDFVSVAGKLLTCVISLTDSGHMQEWSRQGAAHGCMRQTQGRDSGEFGSQVATITSSAGCFGVVHAGYHQD